jgi:hypothetical protein
MYAIRTVLIVSNNRILVDGKLYKEQRTTNGKYPKEYRAAYMKAYRQRTKKLLPL